MRCNNCGWDNPDTNTRCEKCNSPLAATASPMGANLMSASAPSHELNATVIAGANPMGGHAAPAQNMNKTVIEGVAFNDLNDNIPASAPSPSYAEPANNGTCPNCGYPVRPGALICPNCNSPLVKRPVAAEAAIEATIISPFMDAPAAPKSTPQQNYVEHKAGEAKSATPQKVGATVNPWVQVTHEEQKCVLTPIKQESEKADPQPQAFVGEAHELNRANLDADNMTITSGVQANLTYENGTWYIQDASAQQTTFIHAGDKVALKEGDIILMGNRQFKFSAE